ncbi:hypothetical protein ACFVAJ_17055 [Agromyces sp. NPDC057679]|uniref:hypothetical protein n=1 Tax=Agromyces sp. NPDC057679 TaxID=3346207 RepID=UPI00366DF45D
MTDSKLEAQIDKHFAYLANDEDPTRRWFDVAWFVDFIATGRKVGGRDRDRLEAQVRTILEARADAGTVRRWREVNGPSLRGDRMNLYLQLNV